MKSLATIFVFAAIAVPAASAAGQQPMSDVQLSRPSHSLRLAPLSDVQLSRPSLTQGHAVYATPISDVQLSRYGSRSAAPVLGVPTATGFDWGDASIGAAVTVGAVLLAAAAALGVRNTWGRFQRA